MVDTNDKLDERSSSRLDDTYRSVCDPPFPDYLLTRYSYSIRPLLPTAVRTRGKLARSLQLGEPLAVSELMS